MDGGKSMGTGVGSETGALVGIGSEVGDASTVGSGVVVGGSAVAAAKGKGVVTGGVMMSAGGSGDETPAQAVRISRRIKNEDNVGRGIRWCSECGKKCVMSTTGDLYDACATSGDVSLRFDMTCFPETQPMLSQLS